MKHLRTLRAVRRLSAISLLGAVAFLSACATNPFESRISLKYVGENGKRLNLDAVSGALSDNVSGLKAAYELTANPDGSQTLKITLDGKGNTDTKNQFASWQTLMTFLGGVFAGRIVP